MSYGYDLAGNLTSQTYPSGKEYRTSYDNAGRVNQISRYVSNVLDKTCASSFSYTAHGAVSAMTLGNNLIENTAFNGRLQPTQIRVGTSASPSSVLQLDYTYNTTGQANNNGNVLTQTITAPKTQSGNLVLTQNYSYDALNRLSSAEELIGTTSQWKQTYDIDRWGNRAVRNTSTYIPSPSLTPQSVNSTDFSAFNQNTNRIAVAGFGYDTSGNLTGDPTTGANSMVYDSENRQTSYAKAGATTSYSYDGDGRRVKKVVGNVTTVFVYNVLGQLIAEYTSDPVPPAQGGGGTSYLTSDHLGSTRVVTTADGSVKARYDYLPFGEEIASDRGSRSLVIGYGASDGTRQKFTQKERDNESGLDYFLARYYSSAQGRFTSPDDIRNDSHVGDPQSWNRYAYVRDNPLYYTDPTGKDANVTITTDEEHKKGTITIQASFAIWTNKGSGITDAQMQRAAAEIKQTIEGAWKGSFEKDGIKYDVKTEVSVIVAGSEKAAEKSAANAIELVKGSAIPGVADSYVDKRSFFGGPDTGKWNINNLVSSVAAHEFTHLLGVRDRDSGGFLSNTNMLNDPLVPRHATADDFRWALGSAVDSHRWESRPNVITGNELETRSSPGFSRGAPASYQSTRNVHAAYFRGN